MMVNKLKIATKTTLQTDNEQHQTHPIYKQRYQPVYEPVDIRNTVTVFLQEKCRSSSLCWLMFCCVSVFGVMAADTPCMVPVRRKATNGPMMERRRLIYFFQCTHLICHGFCDSLGGWIQFVFIRMQLNIKCESLTRLSRFIIRVCMGWSWPLDLLLQTVVNQQGKTHASKWFIFRHRTPGD